MLSLEKQKPEMKDIEDHVVTRLATQWRQLGKQLNIDQNLLDILQHDYPNDCEECCSRMLDAWLQWNTHANTTWGILIDAIDRLPTGMKLYLIVKVYKIRVGECPTL